MGATQAIKLTHVLEPLVVEGTPEVAADDAAADKTTLVAIEAPEGCPNVDELLIDATEVLGANSEVIEVADLGGDDSSADDASVDSDADLIDQAEDAAK